MCTLTYLPGKGGFILTSNRDERVARKAAIPPAVYLHNGVNVCYPKDMEAGGTWIATADNGFTLCLLNGAFHKHIPAPPYRNSRGVVLLGFFQYNDSREFAAQHSFKGIEPFTLVIIKQHLSGINVDELRWDGDTVFLHPLNASVPRIWSSVTLYEPEVIRTREQWFAGWLEKHPAPDPAQLRDFHRFGGSDEYPMLINREGVLRTLSITTVLGQISRNRVIYDDLATGERSSVEVRLKSR